MSADSIPTLPVALTAEQAGAMSQRLVKKHHVAIVLLHWFNAMVWLMELATGAALIIAPQYRFMPQWYLTMMEDAFGTRANLLRFHLAVGLTWICVFAVYAIFGFRNYLRAEVLRKEIGLDENDFRWLKVRTLLMLGRTKEPLPPQGAYNAGQKMFALLVYTAVPVIMITGLIMTFHLVGASLVAWAMVLHFLAVGMVVSGLMVHVYMGAVFPEERPAFYSMITGMVNELYAYRHHFTWWRELKIEQRAWEHKLDTESRAAETGAGAEAAACEPGIQPSGAQAEELSVARGQP